MNSDDDMGAPHREVRGPSHRARWRALAAALPLLVALAHGSPPARAQSRASVHLVYSKGSSAATCPDELTVRNAVAARLGYEPWDPASQRVLEVRIARKGAHLVARLELREPGRAPGTRVLRAGQTDCSELAAAVELAVSIAIDPLSIIRRGPATAPATRPVTPASRPAAPASQPKAPPARIERRPPPPAGPPWQLSASVGSWLALGAAPDVTGGLGFQLRLRRSWWSVGVAARFDLPAHADVPGGEVSGSLLAGTLVPCLHRWVFSGCGLLTAGALRGGGHDLVEAKRIALPYVGAGARLAVELPLISILSLRLHTDVLAALTRISLKETGTDRVLWSLPAVSGAFGLAAVARFL